MVGIGLHDKSRHKTSGDDGNHSAVNGRETPAKTALGASVAPVAWQPVSADGEWFESPGFPWFHANRAGRVRSKRTGAIVGSNVSASGYLRASAAIGRDAAGKAIKRPFFAHQIVAAAFMGPMPSGLVVNHKDGNKFNNRPENLEYVTRAENMKHAWRMGLCWSKPSRAWELEGEIAALRAEGKSFEEIGVVLGFSMEAVRRVHRGIRGYELRGGHKRGERNHAATITDAQATEIYRRRCAGERGRVLAKEFGVSEGLVCSIYRGRSWRHVQAVSQ